MNHVWGLLAHPNREMRDIKNENETVSHHYTHHVLLLGLIPVGCAFIGTTQIGWDVSVERTIMPSVSLAFGLAILFDA